MLPSIGPGSRLRRGSKKIPAGGTTGTGTSSSLDAGPGPCACRRRNLAALCPSVTDLRPRFPACAGLSSSTTTPNEATTSTVANSETRASARTPVSFFRYPNSPWPVSAGSRDRLALFSLSLLSSPSEDAPRHRLAPALLPLLPNPTSPISPSLRHGRHWTLPSPAKRTRRSSGHGSARPTGRRGCLAAGAFYTLRPVVDIASHTHCIYT